MACAFQMQVPQLFTAIGLRYGQFSQQQSTAVAQLRVVHTKLVAGVFHRQRCRLLGQFVSAHQ